MSVSYKKPVIVRESILSNSVIGRYDRIVPGFSTLMS